MFTFLSIITTLLFTVQASPLDNRSAKCHPNFQGIGVSVVWDQAPYNTREWAPGAVGSNLSTSPDNYKQAAEFLFEPIGSAPQHYIVKKLGTPSNQVISIGNNQYLDVTYLSSGDPYV
ncbi:hypothetical protein H0H92_006625 [Tricholoma furcatifolium]|nr:hypothetical protein H0H92_006625 [Tricholoma furcatifolium]